MKNAIHSNMDENVNFVYEKIKNSSGVYKEKWEIILSIITNKQNRQQYENAVKNLENKIKDKKSEIASLEAGISAYMEADKAENIKYVEHAKKLHTSSIQKINALDKQLTIAQNEINIMHKILRERIKELDDLSRKFEVMDAKFSAKLNIEGSKLEILNFMIEDVGKRELEVIEKIASIEKQHKEENALFEADKAFYEEEAKKVEKIDKYEKTIIPSLEKQIQDMEANIAEFEIEKREKTLTKEKLDSTVEDLNSKIQIERNQRESLLKQIEDKMAKRDALSKITSIMDMEKDENFKDLLVSDEFQKGIESIQKTETEYARILKDVEDVKRQKEELYKEIDTIKGNQALEEQLENELKSIEKDINEKQKELDDVKEENSKILETVDLYNKDMEDLDKEYDELKAEYDALVQKDKESDNSVDKNKKAVKEKENPNAIPRPNDMNLYIKTWLKGLPDRFSRISSDSRNSSTCNNNTLESNDIVNEKKASNSKGKSLKRPMKEKPDVVLPVNKLPKFDVTLPDPEEMEDNLDFSFAETNTSDEFLLDDSEL